MESVCGANQRFAAVRRAQQFERREIIVIARDLRLKSRARRDGEVCDLRDGGERSPLRSGCNTRRASLSGLDEAGEWLEVCNLENNLKLLLYQLLADNSTN